MQEKSLTQLALQRFKKNFWGVLSFIFIIICGIIAVFAYVFAPDDSRNANQMHLSIHSKKPGFEVTMLTVPGDEDLEQDLFGSIFFGKKNTDTEIPILSYQLKAGEVLYVPYNEDGDQALVKSVKTDFFDAQHLADRDAFAEAYIAHKKFIGNINKNLSINDSTLTG